jgi:hypothetical protein
MNPLSRLTSSARRSISPAFIAATLASKCGDQTHSDPSMATSSRHLAPASFDGRPGANSPRRDLFETALEIRALWGAGVPAYAPASQGAVAFLLSCQGYDDRRVRLDASEPRDHGGFATTPIGATPDGIWNVSRKHGLPNSHPIRRTVDRCPKPEFGLWMDR